MDRINADTNIKNVALCCRVFDACTTSNKVQLESKCVLNVILESKLYWWHSGQYFGLPITTLLVQFPL